MSYFATDVAKVLTDVKGAIMADAADCVGWIKDFSPTFAWSFFRQASVSGTPFPFSPFVARALLKKISQGTAETKQRLILEAGPGSGAMTRHIVKKLGPKDRLVLVEYDKKLCKTLEKAFQKQITAGLVEVHNAPLQEWDSSGRRFDAIVSTIPLNSLADPKTLGKIFSAFKHLAKENCPIAFGECAGTATLSKTCPFRDDRSVVQKVVAKKGTFFKQHRTEPATIVWRNLPPARVIHCMLNKTEDKSIVAV